MSKIQKQTLVALNPNLKGIDSLDFVSGWYFKAIDYMKNTNIDCCFVSTNSIVQGTQAVILWNYLLNNQKVVINYAYRSFKWMSEAKSKANVYVVIVDFSFVSCSTKFIVDENNKKHFVDHINGYLVDSDDIYISSKGKPLSNVSIMSVGNQPIDNGYYLFTKDEMIAFVKKEPNSEPYFRKWYGSREFLNRSPRYCLYVGDMSPKVINSMSLVKDRVKLVRDFRLKSKRKGTRALAQTPILFHKINIPTTDYLVVPEVSSYRRQYIPIGYLPKLVLASNKLFVVSGLGLYGFGVLESIVHMAWMRLVAGRLKKDYNYSVRLVYNTFPWPTPTPEQKHKIEETAQKILDVRKEYPDSSLADLYDPLTMPADLRKAHEENDKAVLSAYGLSSKATESEIVAHLFKMYEKLTKDERK